MPMDPDKRYPALDALVERIEPPAEGTPRLVIAGTAFVAAVGGRDQAQPKQAPELAGELLQAVRAGLATSAPVVSGEIRQDIPDAALCGPGATAAGQTQADLNCVLPDRLPPAWVDDRLRAAGATHVVLVVGGVTQTTGERETTWGVAAGYGGAAPAFTTETEVVHHFTVHARVYDVASGALRSDLAVSDEDAGSYGVMGMIMPYNISVDDAAYFATMGSRVGEEIGKRFMRGLDR